MGFTVCAFRFSWRLCEKNSRTKEHSHEREPVHRKQLLTYLRLADKRLGLLINFNVELIKEVLLEWLTNFDFLAKARRETKGA